MQEILGKYFLGKNIDKKITIEYNVSIKIVKIITNTYLTYKNGGKLKWQRKKKRSWFPKSLTV